MDLSLITQVKNKNTLCSILCNLILRNASRIKAVVFVINLQLPLNPSYPPLKPIHSKCDSHYSMLILFEIGAVDLGTTMLRIPFFKLALTAS